MFVAGDVSSLRGCGTFGVMVGAFSPGRCPLLIRTVVFQFGKSNFNSQIMILRSRWRVSTLVDTRPI